MAKEIINSEWFRTMQGTIGVVAVNKDDKGWKAYIGLCTGKNVKFDQQLIADLGCPVRKDIAKAIFPNIPGEYIY